MDQQLKDLKSVLRSLVVSSATQVDVRSLMRDYRNMMGEHVPIAKYGYRDPVQFLRERCTDSFVLQGSSANPVLTLIVPETLKHIDQFVQKQKLSSTVKFKGKRRSIPEQVVRPQQHLIASTYKPIAPVQPSAQKLRPVVKTNITPTNTTNNNFTKTNITNSNITPTNNDLPSKKTELSNSRIDSNIKNDEPRLSKECTVQGKENSQANGNNHVVNAENYSQSKLHSFLRKRMPLYNSTHNVDSEKSDEKDGSSKGETDSGRLTSSSHSSTKTARLEELKTEIRDLIAEYPEGIWCTDLISLYREKYKRELNFSRFGHTSIVSFVCTLEDVVHISRPLDKGNWLLRDARAVAAVAERPRRSLPVSVARFASHAGQKVDPDDALPGIDFDPDVFPVDCMHFMESIPAASLRGLETGAMLEVMVGEVYSPSHLWLLRLGDNYNIAMEDLMDEMTQYYTHGEGKDRRLALGAVRVGHYCSSVFERDWHRSLIVRISDSDTVKVRHVDYGTVESVRVSDLKPLRRCWGSLPAQAVRARLAGVRPPAAGRRWPHAASAHFLGLVRDARLVANVVAVDVEEDILEVLLINTSTEEDVCLSAEMIRSGHADARGDSALRTPECYLFPRFDALESGATPNYGDIHAYLRDGIALEYVEEYRRHVPACLPPPTPSTPSVPTPSPPDLSSSETDSGTADDDASSADETPEPITPERRADPAQSTLSRSASSPCESSPPPPPPRPARAASAHPSLAAPVDVINRVPLWPPPPRAPPPPHPRRFPPPPPRPTPLAHAYSQLLPMPGYVGFPPFPGAVPLYPPLYPPPMMLPPYGPPPAPRPPPAPPRAPSPPPPYTGAEPVAGRMPAGEVTLSVSECEIFKLLTRVDSNAAHWYMVDAITRAMRTTTTGSTATLSSLDPNAPEFRGGPPVGSPVPPHPLPPGMRPPPGF